MTKLNFKKLYIVFIIPTVLLLLVFGSIIPHGVGISETANQSDSNSGNLPKSSFGNSKFACTDSVNKQTQEKLKSVNMAQATLLSNQNAEFQSKISGYGNSFNSVFVEGSVDPSCNVTWNDVNMVYDLKDSKGKYLKHIVVSEDPSLNEVLRVSEQAGGYLSSLVSSYIWSGYEFYYNQTNGTKYPVWEANSTWSVPSVSYPTNPTFGNNACHGTYLNPVCDTAVWIGLEDEERASPDSLLAQGGSDSNMTCTTSTNCTTNYTLVYDYLPARFVFCSNITVNPGDTITANIYDYTKNPNATNSSYYISIQDLNYNTAHNATYVCGASKSDFPLNNPNLAAYIVERDLISGYPQTLANFSSITMSGNAMYYNNSYHNIQSSANNGYYYKVLMQNP